MDETAFFRNRKILWERLLPYGFEKEKDAFRFSADILDGQFRLFVSISGEGHVDTKVIDTASGGEYVLHRVSGSAGSFAGSVREAYESVLLDISDKCFEENIFQSEQTKAVIAYVRKTYGDEPEYLWEKFPGNAVWRRKDNQKWYGALLCVSKRKLGIPSDDMAEILDLRAAPGDIEKIVDNKSFFAGWHMNKRHWFTVILDGSVSNEEILQRIDTSRAIASNN